MKTIKKILIAGKDSDYANYTAALNACGAEAEISLNPCTAAQYDGLLLPGGYDMNPRLFDEENLGSKNIDDQLDAAQLRLLKLFVHDKKPVLGICRGHQVINVYFGGTLIQHMDTASLHKPPHGDIVHNTFVKPGCFLEKIYGASHLPTNSCHHQAVGRLGRGLIPIQYTDDKTVEAMAHEYLPIISVQWHPERMMLSHSRPDTVCGAPVFTYYCHLLTSQ